MAPTRSTYHRARFWRIRRPRRTARFLQLLALLRTLPPPRDLHVCRALGEDLALRGPFNLPLSLSLDAVALLQEAERAPDQ